MYVAAVSELGGRGSYCLTMDIVCLSTVSKLHELLIIM